MDFHSVMETFAEAWVAANTQTPLTEAAEAQGLSISHASLGLGLNSSNSFGELFSERREHDGLIEIGNRAPVIRSPLHSPEHRFNNKYSANSPPLSQSKSIPVHTIVEQIQGPPHTDHSSGLQPTVELDTYAIVPTTIRFNELVRTALLRLGYSASETVSAKGAIQIKNWKQLSFEQITDTAEVTVGEILGEVANVATLYIRLYSMPESPQEWTDTAVRNAVLVLLREMSQSKLASLCPLSQPLLSNIMNNKYNGKIGKDKCQEFGSWYINYCKKDNGVWPPPNAAPTGCPRDGRLTFHPTKELPTLKEWYQSNRSPSHATLQMYVDILNQGTVRQQERPKVTICSLKNWWKNERQRERKSSAVVPEKKKKRKLKKQNEDTNKCKEEAIEEKC